MMKALVHWVHAGLFAAMVSSPFLSSSAMAEENIVIAVAGPMTGKDAALGKQMQLGAEKAVADINAAGGLLGKKLKLEIGDDACDPKQAVAVANQLVNKGVKFVAGHFCSGSSIPASKVYEEEGVLQISPGSTNPKFTDDAGDLIFRVCGRDDQQGAVAGQFIATHYKDAKVAVLHDKTAYGKGIADETLKALHEAGKKETLLEAITAGEKDYSAIVSKMKKEMIDVVYLGGYYTEAGLIIRQMREQGMKTVLISGDALMTSEFWAITGDAGDGTLMTFSPDPRKNEAAAPVVESFRKMQVEPEGYVLYTYGAIQTWADAANKAKSIEAKEVSTSLMKNEFETVLGKISFDKNGDVKAPGYVMYTWKGGKYDYFK